MPTNTLKSLFAAALLLAPALSPAESVFFQNTKEWRQLDATVLEYLGGETNMFAVDGYWVLSPCLHPSPFIIPPNILCPLGTTGFIAQGDIDEDGENDQGSFWSISEVVPALRIEPFRPDLFRLLSAPPSGFTEILRATDGDVSAIFDVTDRSVIIWYDVLTDLIDDYEITQYTALRSYGTGQQELDRHYHDVPWGPYKFILPGLVPNNSRKPPGQVIYGIDHLTTPDAYPGRGEIAQGWRNTNDDYWENGAVEYDPRLFFRFEWGGLGNWNTVGSDILRFSLRAHQYVNGNGITAKEHVPDFIAQGSVTGLFCETIATDVDFDSVLEQGKIYELTFTSGSLVTPEHAVQYPITVFGTGGGLDVNELLLSTDYSGGVVTGSIEGVAGTTLTTNRELDLCLVPGQTYRLEITSGALAGTEEFPITDWGAPADTDLTTLGVLGVAPGDSFTLTPEDESAIFAVEYVGSHFLETSDASGNPSDFSILVRGAEYRIEILTGALAGTSHGVRNWGFPTNAYLETETDLLGSLQPGDIFSLNLISRPTIALSLGDKFTIAQVFEDWVQDKVDAGEMLFPEFALEDVIVFPPYPLETPVSDRNQFLLGLYDNQYEIGPFFFNPGDSADARLEISRNIPSSGATFDSGTYGLSFRVNFIDTYEGFALLGGLGGGGLGPGGFPFGTPSSERTPHYDFDGDGASNLIEYALGSDVADAQSRPEFLYALDEAAGSCTATLTKRRFTATSVDYAFEYSTDLRTWTTISENDPIFEIVQDDETTLEVSNLAAFPGQLAAPACFLRVKVEVIK